ncbi:endonuclease [Amylibacter marinus]|uniref:Endonuclease n=1 Tax=Amylibacter marinus TaxID=1475483 RepID=A0ABQ5VXV3_9RHOB|nr:endonuclease/exonuclease/phosphatase family protein [Amylibacter marinus]GLQ36260.1 endonuclease [Amylibacter marinus]
MRLYTQALCQTLPAVSSELTDRILAAPRTPQAHRALMAQLEALHKIEVKWEGSVSAPLPHEVTIAAWNLERCLDPIASAHTLAAHAPDIVLLSEMDCGMARTHQAHTTQILAQSMGMGYAYGVEFHELGLGSGPELERVVDDHNQSGWHGNAILSKTPPKQIFQIRLDDHGHWFCGAQGVDDAQPRIGGRVAIAAIFPTTQGYVCAVSTHLESAGNIGIRQSQVDRIIAAVDDFAPGLPVVIGGDLNTGNNLASNDWRDETLFAAAERQGFSFENNAGGVTTRPSRLTRFPDRAMKLDWFFHRDCKGLDCEIVAALDTSGVPLSDHEMILGRFSL